ncbi:MAG TPA: ABC transporter permease subunit [Terriglobales bacterium]|nr:ABC transporter permease subunit [Terriglobales bacterium]
MTKQHNQVSGWGLVPHAGWSFLVDVPIFAAGLAMFYGIVLLAKYWAGPFSPAAEISTNVGALPLYAVYSLLRVAIAYFLSLLFTLVYGYVAAYNAKAERVMIPLLDILQSIPVLSFLPGVMLAMMSLFPRHQIGVELGSILLIFTGQVWNMAFSFYSSLKSIPREMKEAAALYRFTGWQRFAQLELPYASIGLIWNSMMSVAGGWFFLMACEMFVLGSRDFRLPGLGSYLQTASSAGDTRAILWGMFTMIAVIVLLDQLVWRPVIAWSQKFKFEQVEAVEAPKSPILELLQRSRAMHAFQVRVSRPLSEKLALHFARRSSGKERRTTTKTGRKWILRTCAALFVVAILYAATDAVRLLLDLQREDLHAIALGLGATFLRVLCALVIACAWTIPVGVWIGFNPKLARIAQPLAQVAASVPATALFPVVLLVLIRLGHGLGIGSIALMLLGTQWYVLFNVIAGAMAIPTDLKEASTVFRLNGVERWRRLILPGIFPYLVTGLVTAGGGAWNASIVAEYFHFKGQIFSTVGLGATITQATDAGNFRLLLAATIVMAAVVVTINRTVWRPMYRMAESRFKLEA